MEFEISIDERAEDYSIISVRGEIDLHTAPKFETVMERVAGDGFQTVVVDMSSVSFMDSTGLSALMRARDYLEERDVSFRLVSPSHAVDRIFSVTGFQDYFEIFPSREDAISH
jgi:anti-sigma B factor antagonist